MRHTRTNIVKSILTSALLLALAATAEGQMPKAPEGGFELSGLEIKLERNACYGPCPVYWVTVNGRGLVTFMGAQYVDSTGKHQAWKVVNDVVDLLNEFLRLRFFDLPDEYVYRDLAVLTSPDHLELRWKWQTDGATTQLTLTLGGTTKTVLLNYNYPRELDQLAAEVDKLCGTAVWVGTGNGVRRVRTPDGAKEKAP